MLLIPERRIAAEMRGDLMNTMTRNDRHGHRMRSRWAAIGAALAVTVGGGGLMGVQAASDDARGSVFTTIDPVRMLDTRGRSKVGAVDGSGAPLQLQVTGSSVPAGAGSVSMNVTVVDGEASAVGGFVTVYPCDITRPNTSNLNFVNGQTVPNAVTIPLAADGSVCFYVYGRAHLLADVTGFFDDSRLADIEAELARLGAAAVEAGDAPASDVEVEPVDLSDYYRRAETDDAISAAVTSATDGLVRSSELDDLVTSSTMQSSIDDAIEQVTSSLPEPTDLTDYYQRAETDDAIASAVADATGDLARSSDLDDLVDVDTLESTVGAAMDAAVDTAVETAVDQVMTSLPEPGIAPGERVAAHGRVIDARGRAVHATSAWVTAGATPDITVGADGLPVIVHHDPSRGINYLTRCADLGCNEASSKTVHAGVPGLGLAVAIGADGLPIIASTSTGDDTRLVITRCSTPSCLGADTRTLATGMFSGHWPAMVIGVDEAPIVVHIAGTDPAVTRCIDIACTTSTTTSIDLIGTTADPDIAMGAEGRPVIALARPDGLAVAVCADTGCSAVGDPITLSSPWPGVATVGLEPAIAIDIEGRPVIAHRGITDIGGSVLLVSRCADSTCSAGATSIIAAGGASPDAVIGLDGRVRITHIDPATGTLQVSTCADADCTVHGTDDTGITASATSAMIDATGNLATALYVGSGAASTIEMHRRTHRAFTAGGWDH